MPRLFLLIFLAVASALAVTPRPGWTFATGGQDLIQSGSWGCVSGVTANPNDTLTISSGSSYSTPVNTSGAALKVTGDFSVVATISGTVAPVYMTLVGALSTGPNFWNGLQRLDVTLSGNAVQAVYWTGNSASPSSKSFAVGSGITYPVTLEAARIGGQITLFANGVQAGSFADPGLFNNGQVYLGFNVAPTNNALTVSALAATVPEGSSGDVTISAPYLQTVPRTGTGLRDYAQQRGLLIGAAVNPAALGTGSYSQTLGAEFNLVVAENAMKFAETEPGPGQYNFCAADQVLSFAQANGMKARGHNLVWHNDLPAWLTNGTYSPADAASILHDHITTVMGHFKGQLIDWDVVNEAVADAAPNGLSSSYWLTQLGNGYIDQAFIWAHAADPTAKLFYNDYGAEGLGGKSDAVYNLVKGMLSRGVPIHGVGLQMHVNLTGAPRQSDISANIQRLGALGLEVHITEMDVALNVPASAADLAAQATIYQNVLSACQANSNCTALLTWGVDDAHSWIPSTFPGQGSALLFDPNDQPKPAYTAVSNLLKQPGPALTVTKTHVGTSYSIAVTNTGNAPASSVQVTDTLPAGLTLKSVSGTNWNCTNSPVVCSQSASLSPGATTAPLNVSVNVAANAPSLVVNQATVSASGAPWATAFDPTVITAAPPGAPSVLSATPSVFQFFDTAGWQSLGVVNILINNVLDGRNACYLAYSVPDNLLYLVPDAGGGLLPALPLNGTGSTANSQCTVSGAGSSASGSGNTLTLTLNLSFSSSFTGTHVIYLAARDPAGNNSGWNTMAVVGATPAGFPSPVSMLPPSGANGVATITMTYQDATSASNLQTMWTLINTAIDGRSACYVAYYAPGNQLYLTPDNGDGSQATSIPLTGAGSLSNSQCTVYAQGSSYTTNGAQGILTLSIVFKPAFAGNKGVWLAATTTNNAQTSPWQALGAWTVPGN